MTEKNNEKLDRREFLRRSAIAAAAISANWHTQQVYASKINVTTTNHGKKVIVIGLDGMEPGLSEKMMDAGKLPNLARLREQQGYRRLGTSTPPQSPVAWANFINGAGPGSHGIFDFIHRNPEKQCEPFFSAAETVPGEGYWSVGEHRIQLDFWPFEHKPAVTLLCRKGTPFWDYLDEVGINSVFYDLPSNYPPSPSKYGHHRCLSGMGTPDLLGTYGTYQHFAEDGPVRTKDEGGGKRSMLFFENEKAVAKLVGPENSFLKNPTAITIDFIVNRDKDSKAALIEIQGKKLLLKEGQWSDWVSLDFEMSMPTFMPDKSVSGICRFYLQEVLPNFRLYVTPINTDPTNPAVKLTEPPKFIKEIANDLNLFYTTGFQEDHKALSNKVFTDAEFAQQADEVLNERLALLEYALKNYDDGLLFFYFSSTDLQAHMFWWDTDRKHPTRSKDNAKKYFEHFQQVYCKLDSVVGNIINRYGDKATIIVMSDHGFANFERQFNLNTWLRDNGYLNPSNCTSIMKDVDWSRTRAYGLGINGLYINTKGREKYGIVSPGKERETLIEELIAKLESVTDTDGRKVIAKVHRADKVYKGSAADLALAPDLIVGYRRDFRASWDTCLGDINNKILFDNDSVWSADHCADASEVPGVIFSNRPIKITNPTLVDIAPSILTEFGLKIPPSMEGKDIFSI